MNCANCGKKRIEEHCSTSRGMLLTALAAVCGKAEDWCKCPPNTKPPKFISGNWLTREKAERKGDKWFQIWAKHNEPAMLDCRRFKYKYAIGSQGDVIVFAFGDYYNINNEFEEAE